MSQTNHQIRLPSISTITQPLFSQQGTDSTSPRFLPPLSLISNNRNDNELMDAGKSLILAADLLAKDSRSRSGSRSPDVDKDALVGAIENAKRATKLLEDLRDKKTTSPGLTEVKSSVHSLLGQPQVQRPQPQPAATHAIYSSPQPQPFAHQIQTHQTVYPQYFVQSSQSYPVYPPGFNQNYMNHQIPYIPEKSKSPKLKCQRCGITETPEWRRGPGGARTLCNACGLFHAKLVKKRGAAAAAEEISKQKVRTRGGRRILIQSQPSSPTKNDIILNQNQYLHLQSQIKDQQNHHFRLPPPPPPPGNGLPYPYAPHISAGGPRDYNMRVVAGPYSHSI